MVQKKDFGKKYDRLVAAARRARIKLEDFRTEARRLGTCNHARLEEVNRDMDDGYGHWWKVKINRCQICDAEEVVYK